MNNICELGDRFEELDDIIKANEQVNLGNQRYPVGGTPLYTTESSAVFLKDNPRHCIVFGGSGSGKTCSVSLLTSLSCIRAGYNAVVVDTKGDIYRATSVEARQKGYNVHTFDFCKTNRGDRFNPLGIIYEMWKSADYTDNETAMHMLNDLAYDIFSRHINNSKDPFWGFSAVQTFIGLSLLVFILAKNVDEVNLRSVYRTFIQGQKKIGLGGKRYLEKIIDMNKDKKGIDSVNDYLSAYLSGPNDTAASIAAVLVQCLQDFNRSDALTDMLSSSSMNMAELGRGDKHIVYIILPDYNTSYHVLASTLISQIYSQLLKTAMESDKNRLSVPFLFILEEFGQLSINNFPSYMAAARSRGIYFTVIVQCQAQITAKYGVAGSESIMDNAPVWIYLYSREVPLLQRLSAISGTRRVKINNREIVCPLLSVSDLQSLSLGQGIVYIEHKRPFLTSFSSFYEQDNRVAESTTEIPERTIRNVPSIDIKHLVDLGTNKMSEYDLIRKIIEGDEDDETEMQFMMPDLDFKPLSNDVSYDKIIESIDRVIKRLDEEEDLENERKKNEQGDDGDEGDR